MKNCKTLSLRRPYDGTPFKIPELTNGMVVVLYTDQGPTGICGQAMSITCPHGHLVIFPNWELARNFLNNKGSFRNGKREDIRWFEIGEQGTGQFWISVHEETKGDSTNGPIPTPA